MGSTLDYMKKRRREHPIQWFIVEVKFLFDWRWQLDCHYDRLELKSFKLENRAKNIRAKLKVSRKKLWGDNYQDYE